MNNKKLYITLFTISIIFLGIGSTFAFLTTNATATNITQIKSGNLTMTIDGGGNANVSFMPTKCTSDYAIKKKIVATATNTSGGKVSFSIGINAITLGNDYKRDTMKYALTTEENSCTNGLISSGNFKDAIVGSDIWIVKNDYDNITKSGNNYTKTYYLYIWLDEFETQNLTGNISVKMIGSSSNNPNLTTETTIDESGLYYEIKSHADTTTQIDFSQTSKQSNTNGIYMTTNTESGKPVYYYRGNVDNNYVLFANKCWRIIRTTETGGVKLILDDPNSCNRDINPSPMSYNLKPSTNSNTIVKPLNTIKKLMSGGDIDYPFNENYNSPAYVGYMYGAVYTPEYIGDITTLTGSIVFGNDITYNTSTKTYTLKDTYTLTNPSNWSSEYSTIASKYHYTCFTSSNSCTNVNYIDLIENNSLEYFTLSNGKNHLDILKEMLDNSTNENSSTIKTIIDDWYANYMVNYTSYLEDTVFCNDRSYNEYLSSSGWNKDHSNDYNSEGMPPWLVFNGGNRLFMTETVNPTLVCKNKNDKFTVSTGIGNGDLTYPVGLITADEMVYAGANANDSNLTFYLNNSNGSWSLSPYTFGDGAAVEFRLYSGGGLRGGGVSRGGGVRPVVSLKPGIPISGGDGTASSPYVIGITTNSSSGGSSEGEPE